jgi:hypothetical protein
MVSLIPEGGGYPLTNGTAESNSILPTYTADGVLAPAFPAPNVLYAAPFFVPAATDIDGLAFENSGTGDNGDSARMGIYNSTTAGLPGTLLEETGAMTVDANRDVRVGALGSTVTCLPSTKYWIAWVSDAAIAMLGISPTSRTMEQGYTRMGLVRWNAGFPIYSGSSYYHGIQVAHTYGALPSTYGTPATTTIQLVFGAQVA